MKHSVIFLVSLLVCINQADAAIKPCEQLKAEIAAMLDSKGVKGYELKILNDAETTGKIVGNCEDGLKNIVYFKNSSVPVQSNAVTTVPTEQAKLTIAEPVPQNPIPVVAVQMIPASIKSCDELKDEIATKLDGKGVKNYELTVAEKGERMAGKIVGSCENGSKHIFYAKK